MDCVRLNFSHGSLPGHLQVIRRVRSVSKRTGELVAIMQDLPGPKLRVGVLRAPVHLQKGSSVILATRHGAVTPDLIPVESPGLSNYVKAGGTILLADGSIELRVVSTTAASIECVCEIGGTVRSGTGVNIRDLGQDFETFTGQDRKYLDFGLKQKVDLVAVSFVRNADDIREVKAFVGSREPAPLIVAKIEKREAVENLSEIVGESDAVMVARGDLGAENPIEEVPEIQKSVIAYCRSKGTPVITATQMLESMVTNARPTRAEVTDVANAILDGTDAIMLSEETALGMYPVECVDVMNKIALKAEERLLEENAARVPLSFPTDDLSDAFSASAWHLSEAIGASAIVVRSGDETIIPKVSRFRPSARIIHMSDREDHLRRTKIIWGVQPDIAPGPKVSELLLDSPVQTLMDRGYLKEGERAVFVRDINSSDRYARFSISAVVARATESAKQTR